MENAIAYVRVSREGEDPQNQIVKIREWAEKNRVEIVSVYIDYDVSGAVPPRQRPNYKAMLNTARALDIKLLLFYDLSRLSRDLIEGLNELKRLTEEGYKFKFVGQEFLDYIEDDMMRLKVISDFLWFAQLYREDIRRRTKAALERLRKEGKKLGRPEYPLPFDEVVKLKNEGWPLTKIHAYLVRLGKICREVNGKTRCMSYERFRRRVRRLLSEK
jgi:putative DNA-invertase from lambdoid prophage Rac